MPGNSFGDLFRVTTFGESHGVAIGCIIDGCPPRLPLGEGLIQRDLNRRRPGSSKHVTQRRESDRVKIVSGVFEGRTTGTPIMLHIANEDAKSKDYDNLRAVYRPGHADFTYDKKYGIRDHRGGGRSSARETAARVAAGAVARQLLHEKAGICVRGCLRQMDDIDIPLEYWGEVDDNPFFAATASATQRLAARIEQLRRDGDSCGAVVQVVADGVPAGLGEPVFDRLDADIAKAMMSINAVKGVEIGDGFAAAARRGSDNNDEIGGGGFLSNHAGGILGGISNGEQIVVRLAVKPTSSIRRPQQTVDGDGREKTVSTTGRHDPCVGIRAVPIAEAMLALVLADHWLRQRGQCGDFPNISHQTPPPVAD